MHPSCSPSNSLKRKQQQKILHINQQSKYRKTWFIFRTLASDIKLAVCILGRMSNCSLSETSDNCSWRELTSCAYSVHKLTTVTSTYVRRSSSTVTVFHRRLILSTSSAMVGLSVNWQLSCTSSSNTGWWWWTLLTRDCTYNIHSVCTVLHFNSQHLHHVKV